MLWNHHCDFRSMLSVVHAWHTLALNANFYGLHLSCISCKIENVVVGWITFTSG